MKTINLKQLYYPLYAEDTFLEVEDEIADAIMEEHRIDENTRRKLWMHTYSLDESPGLEYHFLEQASSSEEILLQRASDQYQEFLLSRLDEALATLTPTQIRRLNARFVEGRKFREIAEAEGIDTSIAHHSVRDAVLKLQKYFIKHGWMKPPKEKSICTKISPPKRQRKKQNKKKS